MNDPNTSAEFDSEFRIGRNMIEFVTEQGWVYTAPCGCRNPMDKYVNSVEKFRNYELWIDKDMTTLEIRFRNDRRTIRLGYGDVHNYVQAYGRYLPK